MLVAGDSLLIKKSLLCVAAGFRMCGLFFVAQFVEGFFGMPCFGEGLPGLAFFLLQVLQGLACFCHPLVRVLPEGGATAEALRARAATTRSGSTGLPKAGLCRGDRCGLGFPLVHGPCQDLHGALSGLRAHFQHGGE